jgi:tRNA dimethylallyltransferase
MLASAGGDDKNRRRLIRAIEVAMSKPTAKMTKKIPNNYAPAFIGINLPPNILKARIRERLEKRLAQGMIAEVRNSGLSPKRLRELGLEYRYISEYIKNSLTEKGHANESETLTQAATLELATKIWQYSRRQMTWFRRDKRIKWITDKWIADATNQESALLSDLAL